MLETRKRVGINKIHQPLRSTPQIPINNPMDIAAAVEFAARGNVLELPDLRDLAKTLGVLQTLKGGCGIYT